MNNIVGSQGAFQYKSVMTLIVGLILSHFIIWIALPAILEHSIRLDVAEGVINGPAWEFSYERHPPFSSWLTGTIRNFGDFRYIALYILGQTLALSALLIAVSWYWKQHDGKAALVTCLCFLLSPFATYLPIQVNHNYGVIPFWALTYFTAWYALERGKIFDWVWLGASIGLGLWAKYAILHLVIPLMVIALVNPVWRKQFLTPKLLLAAFITTLMISPHIYDVVKKGSSTVKFATQTEAVSFLAKLNFFFEFALNSLLYQLAMALICIALFGAKNTKIAFVKFFKNIKTSNINQYILAAAAGPVLIVIIATGFGVHPKLLWLTPISISFAVFWGRVGALTGQSLNMRRSVQVFAIGTAMTSAIYSTTRFIIPATSQRAAYSDMDGPALAKLADEYWSRHAQGPIPYLVSFGSQIGRQAIGSIAFDLPYSVPALEENAPSQSPWIDMEDLRKRGALVVAPRGLPADARVAGKPITDIVTVPRPMSGSTKAKPDISFGFVAPDP